MATNNIKIFDENKDNIMSTEEYGTNSQRLNGVQQGIASSMLQNKTLYQLSLVAYAIGQMMVNNGLDANDDNAVSAFVGNLANTIVQKVVDKASTAEAQAGTDANKFMTPATTRAAINVLKATSSMATAGIDDTHWMTPALVKQMVGDTTNWNVTVNNSKRNYTSPSGSTDFNVNSYFMPTINKYDEGYLFIRADPVGSYTPSLMSLRIECTPKDTGFMNCDLGDSECHLTYFRKVNGVIEVRGENKNSLVTSINNFIISILNANTAKVTFYAMGRNL